jgi:hypothetical protein
MTKWALVSGTRVHQVEDQKFEVAGDLTWVPCEDNISIDYDYIDGEFVERPRIRTEVTVARKVGYGDIGKQLGDIYDAIASGNDANDALASWADVQRRVKILFPKDNDDAVQAANDEIIKRQDEYLTYLEENGLTLDKPTNYFTLEVADEYIAGTWICPIRGKYRPV